MITETAHPFNIIVLWLDSSTHNYKWRIIWRPQIYQNCCPDNKNDHVQYSFISLQIVFVMFLMLHIIPMDVIYAIHLGHHFKFKWMHLRYDLEL